MADFSRLSELLNTTEGMTILRNNTAQDDGVDTVTGVDWFTFNGVAASKIYVSGNSFVGFGTNSEHLKICRRDGKMWYLYRQEGTIGNTKFLKIRWQGYTLYSQTSATYALVWELFLFDDGGIYLNLVTVPTNSGYLGTSQLVCGPNTYNFAVAASTPVDYSFLPDGSGGFELLEEEYPVQLNYVSSGTVEFSTGILRAVNDIFDSRITWSEKTPDGTALSVYSKLSSGEYGKCQNGGSLFGVTAGLDVSEETLHIRVEMSTDDITKTPELSNLFVQIFARGDDHVLVISLNPGNMSSIQNAVGEVGVTYANGTLHGVGGPIEDFGLKFVPTGLLSKDHPNVDEHIEAVVEVNSKFTRVLYTGVSESEHIEAVVTPIGTLISIDDI